MVRQTTKTIARIKPTSSANYSDIFGRTIDKTNTRLYEIQRYTDTSLIEATPTAP